MNIKLDNDISQTERINNVLKRVFNNDIDFLVQLAHNLKHSKSLLEEKKYLKIYITKSINDCEDICSPTILHKELRHFNGIISEYVKGTKDRISEIELSLFVLYKLVELINKTIIDKSLEETYQLYKALVIKTYNLLILISKVKGFIIETVSEDLEKLGTLIGSNANLMRFAINTQLNVNWLVFSEIPDDIDLCFKQVKQTGILKL